MDFKIAKKTIRIYDVKGYGRVETGRVLSWSNCFSFVWISKDIWFCIAIFVIRILGYFNLSYENYCDFIFNQFTPHKIFMIFEE